MNKSKIAHRKAQQGYTLVEMSIVLVILGLLIGGALSGAALIHAAKLRDIIRESEQYRLAVNNFHSRYQELPGDFDKATDLWGEAHTSLSTCRMMDKTDPAIGTCNGNGDNIISSVQYEPFLAWQHLQKSGLIEGQLFSGRQDPACVISWCRDAHLPGYNSPTSGMGNMSGWSLVYKGVSNADENNPNWFIGSYGHVMIFGQYRVNAAPSRPVLMAEDAYSIDLKLDDGKPARGSIVVRTGDYPSLENCTETSKGSGVDTSSYDMESVYRITHGDPSCSLIFRNVL